MTSYPNEVGDTASKNDSDSLTFIKSQNLAYSLK